MKKTYARMSPKNSNEMVVQMNPIQYGDSMYYGCQRIFLKNKFIKDNEGTEQTIQVVDDSKPTEYDQITKQIIDAKNTGRLNAQSMLNEINQQRFNSQLMLDNMNLQKMTSQLMLEVNQLKNGGNK